MAFGRAPQAGTGQVCAGGGGHGARQQAEAVPGEDSRQVAMERCVEVVCTCPGRCCGGSMGKGLMKE